MDEDAVTNKIISDDVSMEDLMAEIGRRLDANAAMGEALLSARQQLVTLGGGRETGDSIQRAVLELIDAALIQAKP